VTVALVLAALLAVAVVVYVARPFLREPEAADDRLDNPGVLERRHLALAEERGMPVAVVRRQELAFDLDRPGDILRLLEAGHRGRTREVCVQMDLGERLGSTA